ncbi:MAG TPA: ImmA/IrrE family metallo-endopeptidase [Candidatus Hypogeohydataceae bacterium YC41]
MATLPSVPWLNYEQIRIKADSFLEKHHPSKTIPIPIEEIVEFKLELDIVPLPGLRNIDVDGFMYSDLSAIAIDQTIVEHVNPSRYRFTLAHEIGHLVLHSQLYRDSNIRNIRSYLEFVRNLPQPFLDKAEWEAYCFAGLVLVPRGPLKSRAKRIAKDVAEIISELPNKAKAEENTNLLRDIVEKEIAKVFKVSQPVISKRVGYDKLDLDKIITEAIHNLGL